MKALSLAISISLGAAQALGAQGATAASLCAAAQDSIAAGAFASGGTTGLVYCGAAGASSLSTLISQSGTAPDDGRFEMIARIAMQIRSPSIVNSALAVAQNPANATRARVTAFQVLVSQFNNLFVFDTPLSGARIESCTLGTARSLAILYDGGLSTSLLQQIMNSASTVYHGATDDPVVRSAAYCARTALNTSFPFPINTSLVTLSFVCGDKFRIHNGNAERAELTWNSYHVPPNVRTVAPILTKGFSAVDGNSDGYIRTDSIATARLYYHGQLIQTRANAGTACH